MSTLSNWKMLCHTAALLRAALLLVLTSSGTTFWCGKLGTLKYCLEQTGRKKKQTFWFEALCGSFSLCFHTAPPTPWDFFFISLWIGGKVFSSPQPYKTETKDQGCGSVKQYFHCLTEQGVHVDTNMVMQKDADSWICKSIYLSIHPSIHHSFCIYFDLFGLSLRIFTGEVFTAEVGLTARKKTNSVCSSDKVGMFISRACVPQCVHVCVCACLCAPLGLVQWSELIESTSTLLHLPVVQHTHLLPQNFCWGLEMSQLVFSLPMCFCSEYKDLTQHI